MVWHIICAYNKTTTLNVPCKRNSVTIFLLIYCWKAVMFGLMSERKCTLRIKITTNTSRLSAEGFVLVITGCYQARGIPIYGNLSSSKVIRCNAALKNLPEHVLTVTEVSLFSSREVFTEWYISISEVIWNSLWFFFFQATNGILIKMNVFSEA